MGEYPIPPARDGAGWAPAQIPESDKLAGKHRENVGGGHRGALHNVLDEVWLQQNGLVVKIQIEEPNRSRQDISEVLRVRECRKNRNSRLRGTPIAHPHFLRQQLSSRDSTQSKASSTDQGAAPVDFTHLTPRRRSRHQSLQVLGHKQQSWTCLAGR